VLLVHPGVGGENGVLLGPEGLEVDLRPDLEPRGRGLEGGWVADSRSLRRSKRGLVAKAVTIMMTRIATPNQKVDPSLTSFFS
jgi:hypothetical protein